MQHEANELGDQDRPQRAAGREGPPIKLILFLVLVILLAVFFLQNGDDAPVSFLFWDGMWPIWLVIAVSVIIGVALDRLAGFLWNRARERRG